MKLQFLLAGIVATGLFALAPEAVAHGGVRRRRRVSWRGRLSRRRPFRRLSWRGSFRFLLTAAGYYPHYLEPQS
jgi:hypothetical protein